MNHQATKCMLTSILIVSIELFATEFDASVVTEFLASVGVFTVTELLAKDWSAHTG